MQLTKQTTMRLQKMGSEDPAVNVDESGNYSPSQLKLLHQKSDPDDPLHANK